VEQIVRDACNRIPVNKTAAIVTSQSGCASDNALNNEQLRENLVLQLNRLKQKILLLDKKSLERKTIGQEMQVLQNKINEIRPAKKAKGVDNYFIDAAREILTPPHFNLLMGKAVAMMKKGE